MRRFAFLRDNIGYMRRIVCKKGGVLLYLHEQSIMSIIGARPAARAVLRGDEKHPGLRGYADFFPYRCGTVVIAELWGLSQDPAPCASNIFAMHIHATGDCTGYMDMSFPQRVGTTIRKTARTLLTREICRRCLATGDMHGRGFIQIGLRRRR